MEPAEQVSIGTLASNLVDQGKEFARAEVDVYRAKLLFRVGALRNAAILGVVAIVLVLSVVGALLVGLILTLAPRVGPGWATLIVVVGTLIVSALLGWLAASSFKRGMDATE